MSKLTNNTAELNKILAAVNALPEAGEGGINPTGEIEIIKNGKYDVTNYASADVNVPSEEPVTEELSVTENGTYEPDEGVDGFSKVTVAVPDIPAVVEDLEVTVNGEYTPDAGVDGFSKVTVNVPSKEPVLQEGNATPTKSQQTINPPSGVDGFSEFVVEPIPDEYIVPEGATSIYDNGMYEVSKFAYAYVNVSNVPAVIEPLEVTENGTYTAPSGVDGYSPVTVNVPSENLDAEIEAQAALIEEQAGQIEELLTVLDGKAAGGGSGEHETCTLRVTNNGNDSVYAEMLMFVTLNEDGSLKPHIMLYPRSYQGDSTVVVEGGSIVVHRVVVGQPVYLYATTEIGDAVAYMTNAKTIDGFYSVADSDVTELGDFFVCTVPNGETVVVIRPDGE